VQGKARFFGKHEHTLDAKGRVILPARFRSHFEHGAYLSQYTSRCLALWTPEEFDLQLERMDQQQDAGPDEMNQARYFAAGTVDVEVDRQGRFIIPSGMREFARLENQVLVNGAINRVELWSPAVWNDKVEPAERALTQEN
jgi:MraZ protein